MAKTTARPAKAPDTRERILRVALATFAEKGFAGATTRDIAARAGVTLGLIQYHFGGKLKLWRAAVDRAFAALGVALAGLANAPDTDDIERAREIIRAYVRFVSENPEFVLLMNEEGKRSSERMRWLVDRHVRPLYERIVSLLANAQREGHLPRHIAPFHFFYILLGASGMLFHQAPECRRLAGVEPLDPTVVETHADAVAALILASWRPTKRRPPR